ncbi:hypothetical protein SMICM304S_08875 [Streptomyces microflavus]
MTRSTGAHGDRNGRSGSNGRNGAKKKAAREEAARAARFGGPYLDGFRVADSGDDDPVLVEPDGHARDAWREDYPYENKLRRRDYEKAKRALQIELLKLQHWVKERDERLVILFEGRDAAGKGGTIKRFTEHLRIRVVPASWPWRSPPNVSAPSGTSSGTRRICRAPGRSCSSTAPGTTGPGSSG